MTMQFTEEELLAGQELGIAMTGVTLVEFSNRPVDGVKVMIEAGIPEEADAAMTALKEWIEDKRGIKVFTSNHWSVEGNDGCSKCCIFFQSMD
jgi:hypothetical protein